VVRCGRGGRRRRLGLRRCGFDGIARPFVFDDLLPGNRLVLFQTLIDRLWFDRFRDDRFRFPFAFGRGRRHGARGLDQLREDVVERFVLDRRGGRRLLSRRGFGFGRWLWLWWRWRR